MAGKTTSAGYRLPVASSSYHEKCISASVKAIQEASKRTSDKTYPTSAYRDCNVVAQETIWKEYVKNELKAAKSWDRNWGFLAEYDYKGNPRARRQLPEKESYYGQLVPPTASKQVGSRVLSPNSRDMCKLEMLTCHRKRKTDLGKYYS